ncbi:MAG: hypothetical protein PHI76_02860 [Clostridia bacterium]|nr:hypothetical protein [Clostridia bacterium]
MNIKKAFSNLKKFVEINLRQDNLPKQTEEILKLNADKKTKELCTLCNLFPTIKNNETFKTFSNKISDFSFKKVEAKGILNQIDFNCTLGNIQMQDGSAYEFKSLVKSQNEDSFLLDNQNLQSLNLVPKQSKEKKSQGQEILSFIVYTVKNPFNNSSLSGENYEKKFLTLLRVLKSYPKKEQQVSYFDNFGNWLATDFVEIMQNAEGIKYDYLHTVVMDIGINDLLKNETLEIDENTFKQKPRHIWYLPEKYYTNRIPVYEYLVSKFQSERVIVNPFNAMPNTKSVKFSSTGATINLNDIKNKLAVLNTYKSEIGKNDIDFDILGK